MHEEADCGERHGLVWKYMIPLAECLICGDQDVLARRHTATALLGAFMFMGPSIILSGFAALLPQYAAMAALALCSLAAAGWLFRKRSA